MPKQIRCSNCGDLVHKNGSSVCEKYFQNILLEPTRQLEDGIQLTKAVNDIRNFIDERPGIIKEDIVDEEAGYNLLPLHWVCAEKCPLQVVQLVYEKYPEAVNMKRDNHLPLHCAFFDYPNIFREDVIRFLISKNPDARKQCPDFDQIPLHHFCATMTFRYDALVETRNEMRLYSPFDASEETLDELLLNCPETLWTERPGDNKNALQISSSGNLSSMLRKKIDHYAREFKSANLHESFFHLFRSNCSDKTTMKFYCEEWPEFAYFDLERGARPLHIACSAASDSYVGIGHIQYLITRAPDVLALQDSSGHTPLHLLLSNKDITKVPDVLACQDSSGFTRSPFLRTNEDLVRRGSDVVDLINFIVKANPKVLTVRDNEGFTPLLVASQFDFSLNIIYSMLRFEPQLNMSSSIGSLLVKCADLPK